MANQKRYDLAYKIQAVKLARETGQTKAARELGISVSTLRGWCLAADEGRLDLGMGTQKPQTALTLVEEVAQLRKQVKTLSKENRRLQEENEFLAEASAFFAASRRKSAKGND